MSKSQNNINKIKFLGDSFVWGQSLDFYDYGHEGREVSHINSFQNVTHEFIKNFVTDASVNWGVMGQWFRYPYPNCELTDIEDKRYINMVEKRWTTQVCKHFNAIGLQHWINGGSPLQVSNGMKNDGEDIVIIMISDYRRDQWGHNLHDLPPYVKYMSHEVFTKLVMIDMVGEYRYDMEQAKNKELEEKYQQQLAKLTDGGLWKLQIEFYIAFFKYLMQWKEDKNRHIYFIGSWLEDAELLFKHFPPQPEIQWYMDNLIPIYHDDVKYNSFYPLIEKGMTIEKDFNLTWSDHHPNQELHNSVAKSIIKFLEEKYND